MRAEVVVMLQNLTQISLVTVMQTAEPGVSARCQLDFNSKTLCLCRLSGSTAQVSFSSFSFVAEWREEEGVVADLMRGTMPTRPV